MSLLIFANGDLKWHYTLYWVRTKCCFNVASRCKQKILIQLLRTAGEIAPEHAHTIFGYYSDEGDLRTPEISCPI
jgi:hypothetical protein